MDDWNDFGPEPTSFGTTSSTSFASFRSSQAAEPRSVLLPGRRNPPPSRPATSLPPHASTSTATPPKKAPSDITEDDSLGAEGDLDAATDCEDIGLSFRTFNSSDRYHGVSYTKLEVISAQQIQQILHAFHVLIAIAICWSLFSVIIVNTLMIKSLNFPVSGNLLSQAQRDWADNRQKELSEMSYGMRMLLPKSTMRTASHGYHPTSNGHTPRIHWYTMREIRRCELRRLGYDYFLHTVYVFKPDFNGKSDNCYTFWHSGMSVNEVFYRGKHPISLSTSVRQQADINPLAPGTNILKQYSWPFRTATPTRWFRILFRLVDIACGITILVISSLFLIRLVRAGRANLSQEQFLACGMLFAIIPVFNIPNTIAGIHFDTTKSETVKWFDQLEGPFEVFNYIAVSPLLVFFVWATIHSYRILDPAEKLGVKFFLVKVLVLVGYVSCKLALYFGFSVQPAEMPLMTLIIMGHTYSNFNGMRVIPKQFIAVMVYSVIEFAILATVGWQTRVTLRHLRKVPYMKHRSKHTGFRFFLYISFMFFISFFLLQAFLILCRPNGNFFVQQALLPGIYAFMIEPTYLVGCRIVLLGYVIIWAFVNLPHNSVGTVKGWFKASELVPLSMRWSVSSTTDSATSESDNVSGSGSMSAVESSTGRHHPIRDVQTPQFIVDKDHELNQEIVGPVTYRKRESKRVSDSEDASSQSLELKANCFTMQTHVIMFNFAWYVYYYGTPKFERLSQQEQQLSFNFSVFESIRDEETDTQAVVIDGSDRIIVTFKGSTSLRNLRT